MPPRPARAPGRGRPREFCSARCRQWDWVARQRAHELELTDGELVIAKATLDDLHDDLYVLACAVDDAERDLASFGARRPPPTLRHTLDWLLAAARPLRAANSPDEIPAPASHHRTLNSVMT